MKHIAALAFAACAFAPSVAGACPACAPVDDAIHRPQGSTEARPVRVSADLSMSGESTGTGPVETAIREWRVAAVADAALTRVWSAGVTVPWVWREGTLTDLDLQMGRAASPGDVETRASALVTPEDAPHAVRVLFGVRWPTGPAIRDDDGALVLVDAQVGSGSIIPLAGVAWRAALAPPLDLDASTVALIPAESRHPWRTGPSVQSRAVLDVELAPGVVLGAGPALRWDGRATVDGATDPDTGGTALWAATRLRAGAASGWFAELRAELPVALALHGEQGRMPSVGLRLGTTLGPRTRTDAEPALMARTP